MINLILFLISIVVFYASKSRVHNDNTITICRVYGGTNSKYHYLYITICIISVISIIVFGYLTWHALSVYMNKILM